MKNIIVAIDGPAGSGKGTIAQILSKKFHLVNIDTGAMYRCVALEVLHNNLNINETKKIIDLLKDIRIDLTENGKVFLNDVDVTSDIRSKEVTNIVSPISSIIEVREKMVFLQRKMALGKNIIMEGRDITTVVFPNATYKFYLDASLEERAKRRYLQNKEKKIDMSYEEVLDNIKKRDYNDSHKEIGALKISPDAIYIDTTNLTIEEVSNKMINIMEDVTNE